MSLVNFGANDLLRYNPAHKILICSDCQYAIQKSALESHLLRHKIYRGDRQRLLSSIEQLDLLDPDEVSLPALGSPAVDLIPVLSGFCCTVQGCRHLTASSKRMQRHWSETHGQGGSVPLLSSFARPAKLQTFFRGTKVRYFEVDGSQGPSASVDEEQNAMQCDDHVDTNATLDHQQTLFHPAWKLLLSGMKSDSNQSPSGSRIPPMLLNHLRMLPFRISEAVGLPDRPEDVSATVTAITSLVECCEISFAQDDAETAWQGMTTWLARVPSHFNQIMLQYHSPALVVLAHWAAILVQRAEDSGCWLIQGVANNITLQAARRLEVDNPAAFELVASLMSMVGR